MRVCPDASVALPLSRPHVLTSFSLFLSLNSRYPYFSRAGRLYHENFSCERIVRPNIPVLRSLPLCVRNIVWRPLDVAYECISLADKRIYAMLLQKIIFLGNGIVRGNMGCHKTIVINGYICHVF